MHSNCPFFKWHAWKKPLSLFPMHTCSLQWHMSVSSSKKTLSQSDTHIHNTTTKMWRISLNLWINEVCCAFCSRARYTFMFTYTFTFHFRIFVLRCDVWCACATSTVDCPQWQWLRHYNVRLNLLSVPNMSWVLTPTCALSVVTYMLWVVSTVYLSSIKCL